MNSPNQINPNIPEELMTVLRVNLVCSAARFVDNELFGQSPAVDLLEELGFEYESEIPVDGFGYEYVLKSTVVPNVLLTSDILVALFKVFEEITLTDCKNENGESTHTELYIPLESRDELECYDDRA